MKRASILLSLTLLAVCGAGTTCAAQPAPSDPPVRSTPFPDVPRNHWAFDAVEQLRQRGILRGYPPEAGAKARQHAPAPKPSRPSPKKRGRRR
jgi:hypothetical protein